MTLKRLRATINANKGSSFEGLEEKLGNKLMSLVKLVEWDWSEDEKTMDFLCIV